MEVTWRSSQHPGPSSTRQHSVIDGQCRTCLFSDPHYLSGRDNNNNNNNNDDKKKKKNDDDDDDDNNNNDIIIII